MEKTTIAPDWICEKCGKKLPKTGVVWGTRYKTRMYAEPPGYWCDSCSQAAIAEERKASPWRKGGEEKPWNLL